MNNIKQALESAIEVIIALCNGSLDPTGGAYKVVNQCKAALAELDKCEPVAYTDGKDDFMTAQTYSEYIANKFFNNCTIPLYTSPPQQQWVGLTSKQITNIGMQHQSLHQVAKAIDNELRKLNNV